jgi:hypothetical protein
MSDSEPPFSPPYKTFRQSPEGMKITETLADGTVRDVAEGELAQWVRASRPEPFGGAAAAPSPSAAKPPARPAPGGASRAGTLLLEVPFAEKDDAKRLGARWDAAARKWYVPHGLDIKQFSRWWPDALRQEAKAAGRG